MFFLLGEKKEDKEVKKEAPEIKDEAKLTLEK